LRVPEKRIGVDREMSIQIFITTIEPDMGTINRGGSIAIMLEGEVVFRTASVVMAMVQLLGVL
jgi:hypothetical protein